MPHPVQCVLDFPPPALPPWAHHLPAELRESENVSDWVTAYTKPPVSLSFIDVYLCALTHPDAPLGEAIQDAIRVEGESRMRQRRREADAW